MINRLHILLLLTLSAAVSAQSDKPTVAILDFEGQDVDASEIIFSLTKLMELSL